MLLLDRLVRGINLHTDVSDCFFGQCDLISFDFVTSNL